MIWRRRRLPAADGRAISICLAEWHAHDHCLCQVSRVPAKAYAQTKPDSINRFCSFMGSNCPITNISAADLRVLCGASQRSLRFRMLTPSQTVDRGERPVVNLNSTLVCLLQSCRQPSAAPRRKNDICAQCKLSEISLT